MCRRAAKASYRVCLAAGHISHHARVGFFREHGGGDCHTQPSAARPMMSAGGSGAPHGDLLERGTRTLASGCPDGRRAYCTYNNEDSRGTPHQPTLPVRYNFHGVLGEARALPAAVRAAELRVRGAAVAWAIPPIPPGTQPGGAGTRSRAGVDKAECCFVLNHGAPVHTSGDEPASGSARTCALPTRADDRWASLRCPYRLLDGHAAQLASAPRACRFPQRVVDERHPAVRAGAPRQRIPRSRRAAPAPPAAPPMASRVPRPSTAPPRRSAPAGGHGAESEEQSVNVQVRQQRPHGPSTRCAPRDTLCAASNTRRVLCHACMDKNPSQRRGSEGEGRGNACAQASARQRLTSKSQRWPRAPWCRPAPNIRQRCAIRRGIV